MKVTDHVEHLLRQGKKPKELLSLGFPKQVVTRVGRQLKEEAAVGQMEAPKGGDGVKSHSQPSAASEQDTTTMSQNLASLVSNLRGLESRIELLESGQKVGHLSAEEVEARLDGTPALGLKSRFKCDCETSGLVALHIQCTKCGKETWWGWFPK